MSDPELLKRALKAFKKRLNLARSEDESRLSHGAMTKGRQSSIVGIRPPPGFAPEVWTELVQSGHLREESRGTYSLVETPPASR